MSRVFTYARFLGLDTVSTWVHSTSAYCSTRQIDSPSAVQPVLFFPESSAGFSRVPKSSSLLT